MLYDPKEALISVFDHGLIAGDGVFETIKAVRGRPLVLARHLERLGRSAHGMGLPAPALDVIERGVMDVLADAPAWPVGWIRITHTSGIGPLASNRGDHGPNTVVAIAEGKPFPPAASVAVVPWPRCENGALAGLKTTSYGENVLALEYARQRGADEAIFANSAGGLCEGTGSNIFAVLDGSLITPPLSSGCLAGITRELVLECSGGTEANVAIGRLQHCEEAFLTSTTRDVQAIRMVDGVELPSAPGPITRQVKNIFDVLSAKLIDDPAATFI
ncbi:aminotransferase class IV [Actinomadura graeca]|uniref:aminotransferase class IV n=1 Tax=Actinomadura graeca TaxID=2750812 RepID=UPI001E65D54A|nr:aminotransferase class IV [Actinomadura graeca]